MKIEKKRVIRDACLVLVLLSLGLLLLFTDGDRGSTVEIRLGSELYGCYSLKEDRTVIIEKDSNIYGTAVIKDGTVCMKSAACDGKDCVKRGAIYREGDCILCLPGGVSITVGKSTLDGVTG